MTGLAEVMDQHDGNARRALNYAATTKSVVDRSKEPGFCRDSWNPLRDLVNTGEFLRVGNFKETMDWDDYVAFLTGWAASAEWDCTFQRVTEQDGRVFLQLEERSTVGEFNSVVNSMSVYEFDDDQKIRRIDVYLQMALPSGDMLSGLSAARR